MMLRRSSFIHQLHLGEGRYLIVHAVRQVRQPVDKDVNALLDFFAEARNLPAAYDELAKIVPYPRGVLEGSIKRLIEMNVLTEQTPEQEMAEIAGDLAGTHGRDPVEMLQRYQVKNKEGVNSSWAVGSAYTVADLKGGGTRVDALLLGDCDIQMEADFLRKEAAKRGIDLHVAASFPDDVRFAAERKHDVIFIGALRARHMMIEAPEAGKAAHSDYINQVLHMLEQLRARSAAPILIDNLPEPTVQPLGLAERGIAGHRARFRLANVAMEELAGIMKDVFVVDIAAAVAAAGAERLLDDGQVGFTHFGSPGWLLQRPESEKKSVHGIFPDTALLAAYMGGNPYLREDTLARTHIDALVTVLGLGRKKCVIVDLDGTLWPGVLAETGSPFNWNPENSGAFSYIGLYWGLHEALLCLKKRGILLACVSKNDEATVRELWKYPSHYPLKRLLTPDDFVTWRVNWNDKVENIQSIAEELGFAPETFLFIDDHPVERERVRQRLPEVEVWGDDPFILRRRLLEDPRLQLPVITEEAAKRTTLVKAQLERQHFRAATPDESQYIASLNINCHIERVKEDPALSRIEELFQRTTQFNTTGRKFTAAELTALLGSDEARVYALHVTDRFGDHGLTGAAVVVKGDIQGLVISCRVLGMGVEHKFLQHIIADLKQPLSGQIIETSRNIPVRNIYRDNGFVETEKGHWKRAS